MSDSAILQRIERLERQNRRLRWLAWCGTAIIVAAFVMGQSAVPAKKTIDADTVRAYSFILRGSDGIPRGGLMSDGGEASLSLMDGNGNIRVSASVDRNGNPVMALLDENQTPRGEWSLKGGDIKIALADKRQEERTRWEVSGDGKSLLAMKYKDHLPVTLTTSSTGEPIFVLFDDNEGRAGFGPGLIALSDIKGKTRFMVHTEVDGTPILNLLDKNETVRATLGSVYREYKFGRTTTSDEGCFSLNDAKGKTLFFAP